MECKDRKKLIYSYNMEKYFFCELIFEISTFVFQYDLLRICQQNTQNTKDLICQI